MVNLDVKDRNKKAHRDLQKEQERNWAEKFVGYNTKGSAMLFVASVANCPESSERVPTFEYMSRIPT